MSPGRGLFRLALAWLALGAATAAWPPLRPVFLGFGLLILLLVLAAGLQLGRSPALSCRRRVPASLPLGEWSEVEIRLSQKDGRRLELELFDHHPAAAETEGLPALVQVPAGGWAELVYRLRPLQRGEHGFARLELRRQSFGRILQRTFFVGEPERLRVLPNYRPVFRQELPGLQDRVATLGIHLSRRRGEGLEFEELRDYRPEDGLRQVDWKATARRGRLISRQHAEERDQQVMLLIDCGRRMHALEGELSHFDHVLNAALLLSWVALRQGDAVGFLTFSGEQRFRPPAKGAAAMGGILDGLFDLQTTLEPSDYPAAASALMAKQRRRALVLLLTNLRDEDADELQPTLAQLSRRHLVLLASTRERSLRQLTDQRIDGFDEALGAGAAHHYLAQRRRAHQSLAPSGAISFDVEPEALPPALVSRYLEIKRAGRL